jgi:hypothetical protein
MSLATLLIPGLGCSARLYGEQIPMLWRHGPVTVADTTRDDTATLGGAAVSCRLAAFQHREDCLPQRVGIIGRHNGEARA